MRLEHKTYWFEASREAEYAAPPAVRTANDWHPVGRRCINYAEKVLTWLRKSQQIDPAPGIVKVNLGSGLYVAPGWINVDGSLKTALAPWPSRLLRLLYPLLGGSTHSREEFVTCCCATIHS